MKTTTTFKVSLWLESRYGNLLPSDAIALQVKIGEWIQQIQKETNDGKHLGLHFQATDWDVEERNN